MGVSIFILRLLSEMYAVHIIISLSMQFQYTHWLTDVIVKACLEPDPFSLTITTIISH